MDENKYPRWKYHATSSAVIVNTEAEEKALGEGWGDSPAEFVKEEKTKKVKSA